MTNPLTVGYVGLGGMGSSMVRRLASSGHNVLAYDIDRDRAELAVGEVAHVTARLVDAVSAVDVVCTSLPDPAAVSEVYRSGAGVVRNAAPGTTLLDFSTVDPFTSQEIGLHSAERDLRFFDCPVSGGPREAAAGELVVFLGGDPDQLHLVMPLLECLSSRIHFIGPVGSGATVKMVNNVIANGTVLLTAEAFVLGVKLGLDPQRLFDVLMTAGARSHHFAKRFPNALAGDFEPGYKLELARKDIALALDVGRKLKMPLTTAAGIHELYMAAGALGLDKEDYVAVIKYFEGLAGVTARRTNVDDS